MYLEAKRGSILEMTGESEAHFVSFLNTHDSDKLEKQFRDRMQLNEYGVASGDYKPRRRPDTATDVDDDLVNESVSIHSHATSEVLDEQQVNFAHVKGV